MTDFARLIERAFPLKQASLDSVHEKNVRHGHISTLHVWPARRPLAASRAALIATLLPDPGTPEQRRELCQKIGGKVVKKIERKKMPNGQFVERIKEETEGGILHWGRETKNSADLEWFRKEIRKAYGGRAPKVVDPFAGGGAIPLEAMRLGCEATAVDINPVAWFILKCTLEYPQKLAGDKRPLPAFILDNEEFMEAFYKANPDAIGKGKATKRQRETLFVSKASHAPDADLSWHIRAWGQWVLNRARRELAKFYPTYADFEPIKKQAPYERQPMQLVPLQEDGTPNIESLNSDFSPDYLANSRNPRWVAKHAVAYLWARTVACKNCRATVPLLKTRWLSKTDRKRVLLTMQPNADKIAFSFGIQTEVPEQGGNAAQKREHDKRIGAGTMSRAGAKCPCCETIMTMEDIRQDGLAGRLGLAMTAVVVNDKAGKEFRLPTREEFDCPDAAEKGIGVVFAEVPFGFPDERLPTKEALGFRVPLYGFDKWSKLFTPRQLLVLGTFVRHTRAARDFMHADRYPTGWVEALTAYLACGLDRLVDFCNVNTQWKIDVPTINHALVRFALPIVWDFAEGNSIGKLAGSYSMCLERVTIGLEPLLRLPRDTSAPIVECRSAIGLMHKCDLVLTDPPYYGAIPYSDLMDWFYIWLRRTVWDLSDDYSEAMKEPLGPKWDPAKRDGELIDDRGRHGGDAAASKRAYEEGMARAFVRCREALNDTGRLVVVFANKEPDAWESLVSSVVRSGFVVEGSWPIQTEQPSRSRGQSSAALSSSVWLVAKPRHLEARPGWDSQVLEEMRENIRLRLREYWDAGIRGPDFVWAATGPALESYSKHPVVKKADQPGQIMTVTEFLNHVRRMVVDYVVGQVLSGEKEGAAEMAAADRLDEPTAYYLLHRHDFGLGESPVGTCILYAVSCGLSDRELVDTWDLLVRTGGTQASEDDDEQAGADENGEGESATEEPDNMVRLKTWAQRKSKTMGYEAPNGRSVPLIDRIHRLMHLWKAGDVHKLDEYLDEHSLRRHELFKRLLQSLIELSEGGSDERVLLESLSNHIGAKGLKADADQIKIGFADKE